MCGRPLIVGRLRTTVREAFSYEIRHISLWFNEVWPYGSLNHNEICRILYENASRTVVRNLPILKGRPHISCQICLLLIHFTFGTIIYTVQMWSCHKEIIIYNVSFVVLLLWKFIVPCLYYKKWVLSFSFFLFQMYFHHSRLLSRQYSHYWSWNSRHNITILPAVLPKQHWLHLASNKWTTCRLSSYNVYGGWFASWGWLRNHRCWKRDHRKLCDSLAYGYWGTSHFDSWEFFFMDQIYYKRRRSNIKWVLDANSMAWCIW